MAMEVEPQAQLSPSRKGIVRLVKLAIGVIIAVQAWDELTHAVGRFSRGTRGRWDAYEHTEMRLFHLLGLGYLIRRLIRP
jgi:hypothetical protein